MQRFNSHQKILSLMIPLLSARYNYSLSGYWMLDSGYLQPSTLKQQQPTICGQPASSIHRPVSSFKFYQSLHKEPNYSAYPEGIVYTYSHPDELVRWPVKKARVGRHVGSSIFLTSLFAYFFGNEKSMSQPGLRATAFKNTILGKHRSKSINTNQ